MVDKKRKQKKREKRIRKLFGSCVHLATKRNYKLGFVAW